jgi:hypothetical protein
LEFELGLWSLETLYKLHDSLKSSVDSVFYAKAELMAQIKAVSHHIPCSQHFRKRRGSYCWHYAVIVNIFVRDPVIEVLG